MGEDRATLAIVDCSSLDEFSPTTFFAYPNPSNHGGRITFWSNVPDCAEVYSLDGRWVMEITLLSSKNEIVFPRGVYLVNALAQQKTLTIFVQ
jgi:hypothetical protein